jgi:hypothetical protein
LSPANSDLSWINLCDVSNCNSHFNHLLVKLRHMLSKTL